jgi:hypothetical protein
MDLGEPGAAQMGRDPPVDQYSGGPVSAMLGEISVGAATDRTCATPCLGV